MPSTGLEAFRTGSSTSIGRVCFAGTAEASGPLSGAGMRILGNYALVYLASGRGFFADTLGTRSALVPGDLIVLFPDIGHRYGPLAGHSWSEMFIVFNGPIFDLWREHRTIDPHRPITHLDPSAGWHQRTSDLVAGPARRGPEASLSELCQLQSYLADALSPSGAAEQASEDGEWLHEARRMLTENRRAELALEDIAARLSLSYDGFRKRFRRLAGVSPARYRAEHSIDEACQLLLSGQHSLAQISRELGYCDQFHLSRSFAKIMGMSPRQFARAIPASL